MILIIPLGGTGERFKTNGYKLPKALIKLFGKPILFYLLDNLNLEKISSIYIPYNKEYTNFNFESVLKKKYPHLNFFFLELENTRGAAETINIMLNHFSLNENDPVISFDCDNFYTIDILNSWKGENMVFTIKSESEAPIYSYVKIDENNNVINIQEKNKISNNACTGVYGFESIHILKKYTSAILNKNITQKGEYYLSGVIKEMLECNIKIKNSQIDINNFVCLGTPLQLKQFYNNYPIIRCDNKNKHISPSRICFDLDNTLVTYPEVENDYTTVKPIKKNIELLNYLKKMGNTIIIYTARRMKTHQGNIGKIYADIGKITFDTLDKFKIEYDEIYFGKPYADFYIDDLAINAFEDIEKEIGFYLTEISPRYFNNISNENIEIIKKTGNDLTGEIYYYNNIPPSLKDLFPIFLGSNSSSSYKIEKIYGVSVSDLYLSELLTSNILTCIFESIKRIQNNDIIEKDIINIYANYSQKVKKRYESFDYSLFENSKLIYEEIINELTIYENSKKGFQTNIHGDPVFTNIIINKFNKIKFIDMRGKINETLTIQGDFLYDWAKLYQSLIGYDSILLDKKNISVTYQEEMISIFKKLFINYYSIEYFNFLKIITKSLLFSLIPLHNNEKCYDYFKLINNKYLNKEY